MCERLMVFFLFPVSVLAAEAITPNQESAETPRQVESAVPADHWASSGFKWGCDLLRLVNDGLVQKEVAVTETQRARITEVANEYLDALARAAHKHEQLRAPNGPIRKVIPVELKRKQTELMKRCGAKAVGLLSAEQQKRLLEVLFQLRSVEVFYSPDVAATLELTEGQKAEIAEIRQSVLGEARELHRKFMGQERNPKALEEHIERLFDKAKQRAVDTLNSRQKERFEAYHGPDINLSRRHLRLEIRKRPVGGPGAAPDRPDGKRN
ncbi:MAG: hypothetical protein ACYTG0_12855 [Planctomycetota bacterium]